MIAFPMAGENLKCWRMEEFGSPVLSVILKYLNGSQCEFSSASSATFKCL